jgi:hypothetical protein
LSFITVLNGNCVLVALDASPVVDRVEYCKLNIYYIAICMGVYSWNRSNPLFGSHLIIMHIFFILGKYNVIDDDMTITSRIEFNFGHKHGAVKKELTYIILMYFPNKIVTFFIRFRFIK